jgi:hypothetical protein
MVMDSESMLLSLDPNSEIEHSGIVLASAMSPTLGYPVSQINETGFNRNHLPNDRDRIIWDAINAASEDGTEPCYKVVVSRLKQHTLLERVGGETYLSSLEPVAEPCYFAKLLVQHALTRKVLSSFEAFKAAPSQGTLEGALESAQFLSNHIRNGSGQKEKLLDLFETAAEVGETTQDNIDWMVYPWVASGAITEIVGKIKAAGKTTFMLSMVRAMLDGNMFMGCQTTQSQVVYLTEQPKRSFKEALRRARLNGREEFKYLCWHKVQHLKWPSIVDLAVAMAEKCMAKLIIVDTIGQFTDLDGDSENSAGAAMEVIRPLQAAAGQGFSIVIGRHERKSGGEVSDSGRGSSAFSGAVDIIIRMSRSNRAKTIREIDTLSRFEETPDKLVIELVDGEYVSLGDSFEAVKLKTNEEMLAKLPCNAEKALRVDDICQDKTKASTTRRVLESLVDEGKVRVVGEGKKGDPKRYYRCIHSNHTTPLEWKEGNETDRQLSLISMEDTTHEQELRI